MSMDLETTDLLQPDAETPRPVVVVQIRKRSLPARLAWPAAILIVAVTILSLRAKITDWRGLGELIGRKEVASSSPGFQPPAISELEIAPPSRPLVVRQPAASPSPPIPPSPPRMAVSASLPPAPQAIPLPAPEPVPDLKTNTALAIAEIERESAKKRAEKEEVDDVEDLKARQFAKDQATLAEREQQRKANERLQADATRKAFLDDLRRILKRGRQKNAADEIVALCERDGVKLGADLKRINKEIQEDGRTVSGRLKRIEKCRALGMNEAKILDDVLRLHAEYEHSARGGRRSLGDWIEEAALDLLHAPVREPAPAGERPVPTSSRVTTRRR